MAIFSSCHMAATLHHLATEIMAQILPFINNHAYKGALDWTR